MLHRNESSVRNVTMKPLLLSFILFASLLIHLFPAKNWHNFIVSECMHSLLGSRALRFIFCSRPSGACISDRNAFSILNLVVTFPMSTHLCFYSSPSLINYPNNCLFQDSKWFKWNLIELTSLFVCVHYFPIRFLSNRFFLFTNHSQICACSVVTNKSSLFFDGKFLGRLQVP